MTYSVKDLAARYAVKPQTVLTWIKAGDLRALNVGQSMARKKPRWRITQESLDAFELSRTATPPPPKTPRSRKKTNEIIEFYR